MAKRIVLTTEIIRGMKFRVKNDDEVAVWFPGSRKDRDAFARWLKDLKEDAAQSPEQRYEAVLRQMDSPDPGASE